MNCFPEIKRNFGFGCMRLPMQGDEIDLPAVCTMVDDFLAAGFNYFDTAHGYHGGKSETTLRECLCKRYPREAFLLTDKLTGTYFEREEDIRPFFDSQLTACGVDYFDFYLMHAQNKELFEKFKRCHAYEQALALKEEGKIRHFGISFHDTAEVLEEILTAYPQIEVVQIQLNYLDYDDPVVQGRRCYEVCRRHGKPVIVMEPVRGGRLVNLPEQAAHILEELHGGSPASYAIRFAAGFEGILMVLSGMSTLEQVRDNVKTANAAEPLSSREANALWQAMRIYRDAGKMPVEQIEHYRGLTWNGVPVTAILQTASILEMQPDPGFADDNNYFWNALAAAAGLAKGDELPRPQVVAADGTDVTETVNAAVDVLLKYAF